MKQTKAPRTVCGARCWRETGLTVTKFRYRGIVTFVSDEWGCEYMHLFEVTDWTGDLKECDEGELAWIDKSRLFELTMWEGDRIFLKLLDSDEPFFSLKLTYSGETLTGAVLNGTPLNIASQKSKCAKSSCI